MILNKHITELRAAHAAARAALGRLAPLNEAARLAAEGFDHAESAYEPTRDRMATAVREATADAYAAANDLRVADLQATLTRAGGARMAAAILGRLSDLGGEGLPHLSDTDGWVYGVVPQPVAYRQGHGPYEYGGEYRLKLRED